MTQPNGTIVLKTQSLHDSINKRKGQSRRKERSIVELSASAINSGSSVLQIGYEHVIRKLNTDLYYEQLWRSTLIYSAKCFFKSFVTMVHSILSPPCSVLLFAWQTRLAHL